MIVLYYSYSITGHTKNFKKSQFNVDINAF